MMIRRNEGFTLVEVLVAILIVAVGILGVAGMQVVSLQQNRDAVFRDTALQMGNDIIDRMRANTEESYIVALDAAPALAKHCLGQDVECNSEEMRDFDIAQWKCRISSFDENGDAYGACEMALNVASAADLPTAQLPEGRGSIQVDGGAEVVTVEWTADRDGNKSRIILRTIL